MAQLTLVEIPGGDWINPYRIESIEVFRECQMPDSMDVAPARLVITMNSGRLVIQEFEGDDGHDRAQARLKALVETLIDSSSYSEALRKREQTLEANRASATA